MPMIINGVYTQINEERAFELETSYYLQFQITSALISIDYITKHQFHESSLFENKSQYYHYYVDHLMYSMGQIANRFKTSPKEKDINITKRIEANCQNYQYNEKIFPILSNKDFRNTIEHIDEHNTNVICEHKGVGGFNLIDDETSEELIEILRNDRTKHTYTLDLKSGDIYVERNNKEMTLNIGQFKKELIQLKNNVDDFFNFIKDNIN